MNNERRGETGKWRTRVRDGGRPGPGHDGEIQRVQLVSAPPSINPRVGSKENGGRPAGGRGGGGQVCTPECVCAGGGLGVRDEEASGEMSQEEVNAERQGS